MDQVFLGLVNARQGHFQLESGHHGKVWLDLETLFVEPRRIRPLVDALGQGLQSHAPALVCGPMVGGAFLAQTLALALDVEFCFTERVLPAQREGLYRIEYRLPRKQRDRVAGKRVAIVDDVISAGSSVRATFTELRDHGATPIVIGALAALGSAASEFFAQQHIPVISAAQLSYDLWVPAECPMCAAGLPVEDATQ